MKNEILKVLKSFFVDEDVKVDTLNNREDCFFIEIASNKFFNKSKVEQHKMVYNVLSENNLDKEFHALQIKTIIK